MKLRYYGDARVREWHIHMLRLLRRIHDEHSIIVDFDRIEDRFEPIPEFPGDIRRISARAVYERDLKHNSELLDTIDQRPSKAYKQSGNLDIVGNVALVDAEGTVRWASTLPGYAEGYGPGARPYTAMDFLEEIAITPSNRFCVDCLHLLNGDETFCPNCGYEVP